MPSVSLELCQGLAYCNFHGSCENDGSNTVEVCKCAEGFEGSQCELKQAPILLDKKITPVYPSEGPTKIVDPDEVSEKEVEIVEAPKEIVEKIYKSPKYGVLMRMFDKQTDSLQVPADYLQQKLFFDKILLPQQPTTSPPSILIPGVVTTSFVLSSPFIIGTTGVLVGVGLGAGFVWLWKKKPTILRRLRARLCCTDPEHDVLPRDSDDYLKEDGDKVTKKTDDEDLLGFEAKPIAFNGYDNPGFTAVPHNPFKNTHESWPDDRILRPFPTSSTYIPRTHPPFDAVDALNEYGVLQANKPFHEHTAHTMGLQSVETSAFPQGSNRVNSEHAVYPADFFNNTAGNTEDFDEHVYQGNTNTVFSVADEVSKNQFN